MLKRTQVTLLIGFVVVVWAITLFILGIPISFEHAKPFSITVAAVTVALYILDHWAWRWIIFKGWLIKRPDLQGTWRTKLVSSYIDPETEKPIEASCVTAIKQSMSNLSVRLYTEIDSSYLKAESINERIDGSYQIFVIYQADPDISLRGTSGSEMHYGAFKLEARSDPPKELIGYYWTDRHTRGSIQLTDRRKQIVNSYNEGKELYGI